MKRAILAAALSACASCSNTSGGALVTLPFEAGGVARAGSGAFTFTTPLGWTVTLDDAVIAVGPFYFNVLPPSSDEFRAGVVIIQATEQTIVDVLDPTLHDVPGGANGETGSAVSVEIGLLAPDASNQAADPTDAETLGAGFANVTGTATLGSASVPFSGAVIVDTELVTPTEPLADLQRIRGADVALAFTAAPQTLQLRIDPTHWFDQSDFSALVPTDGTWAVDTTFAAQLLEGVKSESDVYLFGLTPQPRGERIPKDSP